jgi:release factor glutamine methyltransferase
MPTITQALKEACIDAMEARVLLAALLRVSPVYLIAHGEQVLSSTQQACYRELLARRAAGEPVAYITGEREFYSRSFHVTPAVLIPRPESELLVDLALERLPVKDPALVLDLGTGSGCIAISIALARGGVRVCATDQSADALAVARGNTQRLGAGNVDFAQGHWFDAVTGQRFHLIVSNPPYIAEGDAHLIKGDLRFEPRAALAAGAAGMADIRAIIAGARLHLLPGAWMLLEHGYDQAAQCRELLTQAGLAGVTSWRDLASLERVSGGQAPL